MVDKTQELSIEWLKRDEGLRLFPYKCSANKLSVGYGRNLEDCGITEAEAEYLLINDLQTARSDARKFVGDDVFLNLTPERQAVICCMAFNLGLPRLRKFVKFKDAIIVGDYEEARVQMLDSKWREDVGDRALRLADAFYS